MNQSNLAALIQRLESCRQVKLGKDSLYLPHVNNRQSFNMLSAHFSCGSPACIAGHCADLLGNPDTSHMETPIMNYLDIDWHDAQTLCLGRFTDKLMEDITPADAAEHLKTYLVPGT